MIKTIVRLFLIACLFACSAKKPGTAEEYFHYLDSETSGLSKLKYVNGLALKVKYLAPDYLCHRELIHQSYTLHKKDSISAFYAQSLCFMLTLGTDERKEKQGDVMYHNITTFREYVSRSMAMNFDMQQYITVKADGEEYIPVLSSMENTYGMDNKRSILLVFVPKTKADRKLFTASKIDFIYDDQLFELGINHFLFERESFNNLPPFPFNS